MRQATPVHHARISLSGPDKSARARESKAPSAAQIQSSAASIHVL